MVGLFINALPVRLHFGPEQSVNAWLQEVGQLQAELQQFQHAPLVQVQGWSEIPWGQSHSENLFVFENYPVKKGWNLRPSGISMSGVSGIQRTNYPLMVAAYRESNLANRDEVRHWTLYDRHQAPDEDRKSVV